MRVARLAWARHVSPKPENRSATTECKELRLVAGQEGRVKHGGKHYLAKRIVSLMPPHTHYVEPFFGGGSVLFAKPFDGVSEVVNDLDDSLTNFWRVLQSPELFERFYRQVEATPFCEAIWQDVYRNESNDQVDRAIAFFVCFRQSRQGLGRDFATMVKRTRCGMNDHVSAWLTEVAGLPEAHRRLRRVVILNRDAMDVIRQNDGPDTLFYCDPTYLHATRSSIGEYRQHEMTDQDHARLLELLASIRGRFILSGYPSELYERHASAGGWHLERIQIDNKASSGRKKPARVECLWMNSTPHELIGQFRPEGQNRKVDNRPPKTATF
jgi:DNA adenine methylase